MVINGHWLMSRNGLTMRNTGIIDNYCRLESHMRITMDNVVVTFMSIANCLCLYCQTPGTTPQAVTVPIRFAYKIVCMPICIAYVTTL